jgi:DNA ligase (NAD+)
MMGLPKYYLRKWKAYTSYRGDGYQGDDVTNNIKTIRSIPSKRNYPEKFDIRERSFCHRWFRKMNQELIEIGRLYSNPRNTASGSLKRKCRGC